jgi:hypothetical protein
MCATVLVSLTVAACGGTSDPALPAGVVAEVGHAQITKATLNQWMTAMLGGDYYEITSHVAPTTLLAPPPSHASCVADLESITSHPGDRKPTHANIETLCAELYEAIKAQALSYLIRAQVDDTEAARHGVVVSNQRLEKEFARVRAERFPSESELQTYLTQRHLTLAVEHYVLKQDVVGQAFLPKYYATLEKQAGSVKAAKERLIASEQKWVSETNCQSGYVVARCRQYANFKPGGVDKPYPGESPARLLFKIGRLQPSTSHNFTGHPKTPEDLECHNGTKGLACKGVSKKESEEEERQAAQRRKQG